MGTSPLSHRVGVVGLGLGRAHLNAMQALEGVTVRAVAELSPQLRNRIATERGIDRAVDLRAPGSRRLGWLIAIPDLG